MGFVIFIYMSRKKKNYGIMVKQPQEKVIELYGCSHPSVLNGTMCCDGNCETCYYNTEQLIKIR